MTWNDAERRSLLCNGQRGVAKPRRHPAPHQTSTLPVLCAFARARELHCNALGQSQRMGSALHAFLCRNSLRHTAGTWSLSWLPRGQSVAARHTIPTVIPIRHVPNQNPPRTRLCWDAQLFSRSHWAASSRHACGQLRIVAVAILLYHLRISPASLVRPCLPCK